MLNGKVFRLLACAAVAAAASGAVLAADREGAFDAGVSAGDVSLAAKAVTITPGATAFDACVKAENGQVRIADERGCNPSELPISLGAGNVTPLEINRHLTISTPDMFVGIFGGLVCPANRTLVSGGFKLLHNDLKVVESFVGPGFGLPRVYIVFVRTFQNTLLPAENVTQMWATCL
jgi:hypothetical protein